VETIFLSTRIRGTGARVVVNLPPRAPRGPENRDFLGSRRGPGTPRDASGSLCNQFWWGQRVLSSILDPFRDQVGFERFCAKPSKIRNLRPSPQTEDFFLRGGCIHAGIHPAPHTHTRTPILHVHAYTCVHAHACTHASAHTYTHTHIHMCIHIHKQPYTKTSTKTKTNTNTTTSTHIHIHLQRTPREARQATFSAAHSECDAARPADEEPPEGAPPCSKK
jgi:hypothetical protein